MNKTEIKFIGQILTMFACALLIALIGLALTMFGPSWIIISAGIFVGLICVAIILSILLM